MAPQQPDIEHILTLERELQTSAARRNPERLRELLAPQFIEIGASGRVWDREAILHLLENPEPNDIIVRNLEARILSEDVVQVLWESECAGTCARRSSLWKKLDNSWQQVFHQGTPLPHAGDASNDKRLVDDGQSCQVSTPAEDHRWDGMTDSVKTEGRTFTVRRAELADLRRLVELISDDILGSSREQADLSVYEAAFEKICADPNQFLAAVRDNDGELIGTFQLTLIPNLSLKGTTRLQVEAVHVAPSMQGKGVGTALFTWIEDYARHHGAGLIQLTTNKQRPDAHRFYDRLGYMQSHFGYKKYLG